MIYTSIQKYVLNWIGAHWFQLTVLCALFCILKFLQKNVKTSLAASNHSSQDHLVKNLNDYLAIKKPDYAIMLVGKWGIGKTFFIRNFFKQRNSVFSPNSPIFVSLYGIKRQDEIDKEILKSALPAFSLLLFVFGMILLLISLGAYFLWENITKGSRVDFLTFIGPILLFIAVSFYKEAKIFLFKIILFRHSIVFDDFERSSMSPSDLLAYINRFVEHMHKHVIIVCDEAEITDKNFARMQEKVIGQKLVFSQDILVAMKSLLFPQKFPKLNILLTRCFAWEWLKNNSTPQKKQINLRVWLFCCRRFEQIFDKVDINLLTNKKVWNVLIPQFFALTYSLQIYDWGNGKKLEPKNAKEIFNLSLANPMPDWLIDLFPGVNVVESALHQNEWNEIVDNKFPAVKGIENHWNYLIYGSSELYAQLYNYFKKTDEENSKNWHILQKSYREKSITEPGEIISIFTSVSHMVHKKCCPDIGLTQEKINLLASKYIQCLSFPEHCKHDYQLNRAEQDYPRYALDFCKDQYAAFRKELLQKIEEFQYAAITEDFNKFLELLKAEDEEFDAVWYRKGFHQHKLFSGQNAQKLFDALAALSPAVLFDRIDAIMGYLRDKFSSSDGDIKFWEQFVIIANTELAKETNTIDCSKKLSLRELCEAVQRGVITDNTSK